MTMAGLKSWSERTDSAPAWRIERSTERRAVAPFFPDQNGGVYEKLLSTLPMMLHGMDGSGRILSVNTAWCETLGYDPEDVVGRPFSEFLPSESRSRLVAKLYPQFLVSGNTRHQQIHVTRKDGSLATCLLSMTAYRSERGRIERSVCLLEDISGVHTPVTEVAADPRFRAAFDAAVQGMAIVNPHGQVECVNAAFKRMMQIEADAETYVNLTEFAEEQDREALATLFTRLRAGEHGPLNQEIRFKGTEGRLVTCQAVVSELAPSPTSGEQLLVQLQDASERNAAKERLKRAQKMDAIGQLTGGLAHDFNNLLTVVIGNLQLLDGKLLGDALASKRVGEAIDAARKGSDLTRQLLAIARKQPLAPSQVDVNELVSSLHPLISRTLGEHIDLRIKAEAKSSAAIIDPSQLENAILNLCINARDAMEHAGQITIETGTVELDKYYAEKNPDVTPGPYVMVAVTDTGSGMSPELLEKAFQPFFTTKPQGEGNGLGLPMVYGFIKQSGGHINIYSEVGHGTCVKMYLPLKDVAVPAAEAKAVVIEVSAPVESKRAKILVVEDQEAVRAVACSFLEEFGYDVVEAGDGLQALEVLQENLDIDLMFSDVVMPGGLNGFDLAQAAQGLRPGLKIVHTSGYPKGAMVHQDEPRFKDGYIIMKPYRRDDLKAMITRALENQ